MTTQKDKSGPAFPHPSGWRRDPEISDGMSLRDYFAAKAMQGAVINETAANGFTFEQRAEWSYMQADAMIAERDK